VKMYYPFETQVTALTNVRCERMLPELGEVLVRRGQRVDPTQIVARTELPGDFDILPVAHLLGIPVSRTNKCLRVKPGDEVQAGAVVAARRNPFSRPVKSPMDGRVTASGGGRILIEAPPTPFELYAHVQGTVANVIKNRGVVIETTGALVQGAWGVGGESFGVLKCLVKGPNRTLRARDIDPSCNGAVIIGGIGLDEEVIERAQELQVRGIVTGGLSPELFSSLKRIPLPIVATEGIGEVPMSAPIFRLLTTNEGREASISGRVKTRWGVVRPEIIIPLPAERVPPAQTQPGAPLEVGAQVRIVRAPHMGEVGTVMPPLPRTGRIETGGRVQGAEVNLDGEEPIFVPLANLEVLR